MFQQSYFKGVDFLQIVVNGGIYRVIFKGKHDSEFKGEHPALVIRTLKENEIYMVIPLTTYTKERMEKAKSKGFAIRLHSTNSIAKIDKYQIIHRTDIKNRWKDGTTSIKIRPEEFKKLNEKIEEYVRLSNQKAYKEYEKYCEQYERITTYLDDIYKEKESGENIFTIIENENEIILKCRKKEAYWLSLADLKEIVKSSYNTNATVNIEDDFIIVKSSKNS